MKLFKVFTQEHLPSSSLLVRFLIRMITELHNNRSNPTTIGLANFNTPDFNFIPAALGKRLSTVTFLNIDLHRSYSASEAHHVPILLHAFTDNTTHVTTSAKVQNILTAFDLVGKQPKVIIMINATAVTTQYVIELATTYYTYGAIDAIYLIVTHHTVNPMGLGVNNGGFVLYNYYAPAHTLFPDRMTNLSARPYYVASCEDPALTFRDKHNQIVGASVELIDTIAKRQSTTAQYFYTPQALPVFQLERNTFIDFATYQIVKASESKSYAVLQLSAIYQWCIAVPKRYNRVLHEQIVWPFAVDMWALVAGIVAFFVAYHTVFGRVLAKWYPAVHSIITIPLHMLKLMLLFLLSEYYTAMLTSNLALSQIPTHPKTLADFYRTNIPILFPDPQILVRINESSQILSRVAKLNSSEPYEPSKYAILLLCNRFQYSIGKLSKKYGKQLTHHQFHLISEPIRTLISISPFRKTSPRLHRFQLFVKHLYETGIVDHLLKKWNKRAIEVFSYEDVTQQNEAMLKLDHFIPVFINGSTFLNVNFRSNFKTPKATFMPLLLHCFSDNESNSTVEVKKILQTFELFGKEKKVILIATSETDTGSSVALIKRYYALGVIDMLFLIVTNMNFTVMGLSQSTTTFSVYKSYDTVQTLFPDRLANLSSRSYNVACYEDPPITMFENQSSKVVGVATEVIDAIATHQLTTARYIYSPSAVNVFKHDNTYVDLATYRYWCISVPKHYKRVLHAQLIWSFSIELWLLLGVPVVLAILYQSVLERLLAKWCPAVHSIITRPVHALKLMLLFFIFELYTATLSSNLGLSKLPAYPKTLDEFYRTNLEIHYPHPEYLAGVHEHSRILSRIAQPNASQPYEPSQYAILQLCDRFRHSVEKTTETFGKRATHHQFHLIREPIRTLITLNPFRKTSPRLHRFQRLLVRIIRNTDRFGCNTVGLFNFKSHPMNYVPEKLQRAIPSIALLHYDSTSPILEDFDLPTTFLHVQGYSFGGKTTQTRFTKQQVNALNIFKLFGIPERVIVVIHSRALPGSALSDMADRYNRHGVINIIYVVFYQSWLRVYRLDREYRTFEQLSITAPLDELFPDRLSNRSGLPYKVACYENPPLSFTDSTGRLVGADIDLIVTIASHQSSLLYLHYHVIPVPIFVPWNDKTFDFATYRMSYKGGIKYPFSSLLFPNMDRSCIVVPKRFNRILHEQVILPFAVNLWVLIASLFVFYICYHTVLAPYLIRTHRNIYNLVNTPLHIFRILVLFPLSEYYIAMLTSCLRLSQLSTYPKTIKEFAKTSTPLLVLRRDLISRLQDSDLADKIITSSKGYQLGQVALIQQCEIFRYTIEKTTKLLGKEFSHHHYHLIDEALTHGLTISPFSKVSPGFQRLQLYVKRLTETGVWNYLIKKWTQTSQYSRTDEELDDMDVQFLGFDHFIPVFIVATYVTFMSIDIMRNSTTPLAIQYTPILIHSFCSNEHPNVHNITVRKPTIQSEVLHILETFQLIGKVKRIIVVLDAQEVKPTELDLLAKTYSYFGAIDIIYVLVYVEELVITRLNERATEFVELSSTSGIGQLFPDLFEPYATDLWVMIAIIACGYLLYNLCLKDALQRRHPNAFPIVNTPLHILRILLLFLLTEYYTALLSSNLGLSLMPSYPKTLGQFQKSKVPLLTNRPDAFSFLLKNPDLLTRTITWNLSKRYDPTGLAVIQMCDLFPYTISQTSRLMGKELSRHHYHMINEPIRCAIGMSPFLRTSPLLPRFQLYVDRLYEAGIWDYVLRKWTLGAMHPTTSGNNALDLSILTLEHFLPVLIVGGYLYLLSIVIFLLEVIVFRILPVAFVNIDLREDCCALQPVNTPIVIHSVTSFNWTKHRLYIMKDALDTLQHFGLYGKSKKVIVLIDMQRVNVEDIKVLKESYHHAGAIDILYVLEHSNGLYVMVPDVHNRTALVSYSLSASTELLFPDRLSNLSGQPYKVACIENRPLTYRDADGRIKGIDVDFIDIIAKHQHTIAQYKYTEDPIKPFKSWYDVEFDMATYRVKHEGLAYPFTPLYFPNQFRWCLAVPKTFNRVIHDQVIWPYEPSLWTLILTLAAFFIVYRLMLKQLLWQHFPTVFPIINTPLQILRIMLLFLLTEYYTAMLTAILGLSEIPVYPKTLSEFANSPIPLLASHLSGYQYVLDNPKVYKKTIEWNFSAVYDPTGLALLTTEMLGKRLTHQHYHLIDEPISTSICLSPFRKTSPRLERFQHYVTRLNEAGIWNHLMNKWVLKDGGIRAGSNIYERKRLKSTILKLFHFTPVYIIGGYLYIIALFIFVLEHLVYKLQRRL
uniref:Uncharacterized protein n=1 Tax=Anopheles epiroticus TaxID=199890 RepID=A0A182PIE5_9DIPT